MYEHGSTAPLKRVHKNAAEAVKWYRKAAEQGHTDAQRHLGLMYGNGEGVPENDVEALKWYSIAKAQDDEKAAHNVDLIKEEMTPDQIAKAQELATEWWEKHN
jgi:TPR repeat protein